jgi:hypothetical protein
MTNTQIGVLKVTVPFTQMQNYETAAWYTEHEIQPGTYPVYYSASGGRAGLLVKLNTKVKSCYLGTLYGGVAVGKDTYGQSRVGKSDTLSQSCGFYSGGPKEKTLVPFSEFGEFVPTVDTLPCVGYMNERTRKFTVQVVTAEDQQILALADSE